jgi:hypothetical protein
VTAQGVTPVLATEDAALLQDLHQVWTTSAPRGRRGHPSVALFDHGLRAAAYTAAVSGDFPVIAGITPFSAVVFVVVILAVGRITRLRDPYGATT